MTSRDVTCGEYRLELMTAEGGTERMKGLLGRDRLEPGRGLLLPDCACVHTCFMRFAIDLVYLDAEMTVLKVRRNVKPFRLSWCPGADATLELAAGEADRCGIAAGINLVVDDAVSGRPLGP